MNVPSSLSLNDLDSALFYTGSSVSCLYDRCFTAVPETFHKLHVKVSPLRQCCVVKRYVLWETVENNIVGLYLIRE